MKKIIQTIVLCFGLVSQNLVANKQDVFKRILVTVRSYQHKKFNGAVGLPAKEHHDSLKWCMKSMIKEEKNIKIGRTGNFNAAIVMPLAHLSEEKLKDLYDASIE